MKITFTSPVILAILFISTIVLLLSNAGFNLESSFMFNPYRPLSFGTLAHIFGHANLNHLMSNMLLLLLVGPSVEDRFGSNTLIMMILIASILIAIVHFILSPGTGLMGASGIVFMLIILNSFAGNNDNDTNKIEIPLPLILVAGFYLGKEFLNMAQVDNVSQMAHITGGICGIVFGFVFKPSAN